MKTTDSVVSRRFVETRIGLPFPVRECPFCGSLDFEVDAKETYDELRKNSANGGTYFPIRCNSCDAIVGIYPDTNVPYEDALCELITKWNRRSYVPQ